MQKIVNNILGTAALIAAAVMIPFTATADEHAKEPTSGGRAMAIEMEAEVTAVDAETRQVTLTGADGRSLTITVPEDGIAIETVGVGDVLRVGYLAALEGELRAPTEEEKADPFVEIRDAAQGEVEGTDVVGAGRVIHAVCTIEGMNRLLGTVTVLDSNGKVHVIADVEPEKMSGVTLGQTIVLTFTEAVAVSLEHVSKAE
ncbi:hypothetical protein F0M18_04565 [Pseudohalioglobus sediminis]|uniref:Uncharacterized protein n=1 Tax=Pseudohalioglobus sediminis TaxID=2606449 RepID=A0A5B0X1H4_9GAMM|nr:hypothetical protein [Pseudohalioglobus sediminis]KAA1193123.1 hypothetical protein F0M18_04565 [Pseudohalioglobus sediminis]